MSEPDWAEHHRLLAEYMRLHAAVWRNPDVVLELRDARLALMRWAHANVSFCDGPRQYDPVYAQGAQP